MEREQTVLEEIFNSVTHGVGAILSIVGLATLIINASIYGNSTHLISFSIYGITLILLYLSSTLYHAITHPKAKKVFRTFDHISIFLLISGSYTPFCLIILNDGIGLKIFYALWILTIFGLIIKIFTIGKLRRTTLFIYLAMGWSIVFAFNPFVEKLNPKGLLWLAAGGLFYTFGTIFYAKEHIKFSHSVWHLFVLGGSLCHFFAVLFYLL